MAFWDEQGRDEQESLYKSFFRGENLFRPGALAKPPIEGEQEQVRQEEAQAADSGVQLDSADLTQPIERESGEDALLKDALLEDAELSEEGLGWMEQLTPEEKRSLAGVLGGGSEETRKEARGLLKMVGKDLSGGTGKVAPKGFGETAGELLVKGFRAIKPFLPKRVSVKGPWGHVSYKSKDEPPYADKEIEKARAKYQESGPGTDASARVGKKLQDKEPDRLSRTPPDSNFSPTNLNGPAVESFLKQVQVQERPIITERTPEQRESRAEARAREQYRIATGGPPRSRPERNIQTVMTPQGLMRWVDGVLVPFDVKAHFAPAPPPAPQAR